MGTFETYSFIISIVVVVTSILIYLFMKKKEKLNKAYTIAIFSCMIASVVLSIAFPIFVGTFIKIIAIEFVMAVIMTFMIYLTIILIVLVFIAGLFNSEKSKKIKELTKKEIKQQKLNRINRNKKLKKDNSLKRLFNERYNKSENNEEKYIKISEKQVDMSENTDKISISTNENSIQEAFGIDESKDQNSFEIEESFFRNDDVIGKDNSHLDKNENESDIEIENENIEININDERNNEAFDINFTEEIALSDESFESRDNTNLITHNDNSDIYNDSQNIETENEEQLSTEDIIEKAFECKMENKPLKAISYYMMILDSENKPDLMFLTVLDICTLYKQLGKVELAEIILSSYIKKYGETMDVSVKEQFKNNLS